MSHDHAVLFHFRQCRALAAASLSFAMLGSLHVGASAASTMVAGNGTASLQGIAVGEDGRPLRLIAVEIVSPDADEWSTVTDDAGGFTLSGVAAGVPLRVWLRDDEWYQYDAVQGAVVTLAPGEHRDVGLIALDDGLNERRSPKALDVTDRAVVTTSWRRVLVPAMRNPSSPQIRGCDVARQSKQALTKVRRAVNWYRSMAGLDPIALDSRLNRLAQRSSVIQSHLRHGYLSHDPPRSTRCWSRAGASAAGRSNLAFGANGGQAVSLYMADFGVPSVGHRMWILNPTASRFGNGDAGAYNSLYVVGPSNSMASQPSWIAWPNAGYFPYRTTPAIWSLRTPRQDVDLRQARVRLTVSTDEQIRVANLSSDTDTLLWELSRPPKVGRKPTRVEVRISGIRWRGLTQPPMAYRVNIVR
jgi:uncharacterized protein YkwD